jgi:hypothetical protein
MAPQPTENTSQICTPESQNRLFVGQFIDDFSKYLQIYNKSGSHLQHLQTSIWRKAISKRVEKLGKVSNRRRKLFEISLFLTNEVTIIGYKIVILMCVAVHPSEID